MSSVLIGLAVAAAVVFIIFTQVKGMTLTRRRTVVLPAVLCVVGAVGLSGTKGVGVEDILFLVVSAGIAAAIGLAQGAVMHLEARDGALWGRLPVPGLWLWAAFIVSRIALVALAYALGAHAAASTDGILLTLGINRLAQAAVIGARAQKVGVTFA